MSTIENWKKLHQIYIRTKRNLKHAVSTFLFFTWLLPPWSCVDPMIPISRCQCKWDGPEFLVSVAGWWHHIDPQILSASRSTVNNRPEVKHKTIIKSLPLESPICTWNVSFFVYNQVQWSSVYFENYQGTTKTMKTMSLFHFNNTPIDTFQYIAWMTNLLFLSLQ